VQQAIELREDLAMADEAPGAIFRQRFLTALNDPTWVRFVTWEALDYPRSRRIARQDRRQVALRNQRNAIIAKQFHGTLPKTVKAELLQLALYALATYPLAYAPITKMVTGKLPSDPTFQQEWMAFLDQLGALLAAADAEGSKFRLVPFPRAARRSLVAACRGVGQPQRIAARLPLSRSNWRWRGARRHAKI